MILSLSTASWLRASLYENEVTLWGDTASKSPDKARPHNNHGHGLKEAHNLEGAQQEFERAIELMPDYPDALNNLATIYNGIGRRDEAVMLLQKSLALEPDHLPAKFNMAMYLYESGRFDDSLREYLSIIDTGPLTKEAVFARQMIILIRKQRVSAAGRQ